jgi:hypothetical protein
MKKLWPILAAGSIFWAAGFAAAQETHQQRGKRVVDEALQALGGNAFLGIEDRVETGRAYSFYREQLSGLSVATIYTRYLAPVPGKPEVREREVFGKNRDEGAVLFTEDGAWDISFRGARPLEDQRVKNYLDSTLRNIFYILHSRMDEPGLMYYSQGSDRFENQPVEIVDITDANTNTVTVYFNQMTKLPIRQSFRRRNPTYNDFDTEVTIFGKYREVGGVQWPYDVRRERNGDKIYEMFSESVEINKSLGDELFSLPGNIKILPQER